MSDGSFFSHTNSMFGVCRTKGFAKMNAVLCLFATVIVAAMSAPVDDSVSASARVLIKLHKLREYTYTLALGLLPKICIRVIRPRRTQFGKRGNSRHY